ncbi:MAG: hypothetical protein J0J06_05290 [Sphingomonas sp.]|uniref:hypothetical protein n=1 Tax=Sphingomonas sp. TaxID=28214 RepID=UPI001AD53E54|nr:hypothetical protein [Sphingomonas sp.]MBN8814847.1 hypothetical protein [Sphingomonas sp.]
MADPILTPDDEIENAEHDESGQPDGTHDHGEAESDELDEEEDEAEEDDGEA